MKNCLQLPHLRGALRQGVGLVETLLSTVGNLMGSWLRHDKAAQEILITSLFTLSHNYLNINLYLIELIY